MSEGDIVRTSDLLRPRHVGMPIRRTEDPRLLTGNGEYASDRKPDRALHVAFRRSEQPHAMIVRIDADNARAAPGVVAIFTAEDLVEDYKPVIPVSRMANYYAMNDSDRDTLHLKDDQMVEAFTRIMMDGVRGTKRKKKSK